MTRDIKIDKRLIGHKVIKNMYASGAKKDNNVLGLLLNKTFGINSPVNTTIIVDVIVFKITCVTGEKEANKVALKMLANNIPYKTKTILLPTNIVETKPLGLR